VVLSTEHENNVSFVITGIQLRTVSQSVIVKISQQWILYS